MPGNFFILSASFTTRGLYTSLVDSESWNHFQLVSVNCCQSDTCRRSFTITNHARLLVDLAPLFVMDLNSLPLYCFFNIARTNNVRLQQPIGRVSLSRIHCCYSQVPDCMPHTRAPILFATKQTGISKPWGTTGITMGSIQCAAVVLMASEDPGQRKLNQAIQVIIFVLTQAAAWLLLKSNTLTVVHRLLLNNNEDLFPSPDFVSKRSACPYKN